MNAMQLLDDGSGLTLEGLEAAICQRAANLTAAEAEFLLLIAEFDIRRGWEQWGLLGCAEWMAWQLSIDIRTARDKVRVAYTLLMYPLYATAMSAGILSYAKVRALARIVNVDNADELMEFALAATSNQLERFVAAYRRCEPSAEAAEERAHAERSLSFRNEGATTVITLRLPTEPACALLAAVDRFLVHGDCDTPLTARRADAAVAMAEHAVATANQPAKPEDRYLVTLHLSPDILSDDTFSDDILSDNIGGDDDGADGHSDDLEFGDDGGFGGDLGFGDDGGFDGDGFGGHRGGAGGDICCVAPGTGLAGDPIGISRRSARRILCDAVLQGFSTAARPGRDRLGNTTRTVPARLKRALRLRDGGCRFIGCHNTGWVDAHHILHWLEQGETEEYNLVCLCRRHHRLMHEGGWNISGDPATDLFFHKPDGTILAAQPALRLADTNQINAFDRSSADGRCQWQGDQLDLDYALQVIIGNEHVNATLRERPSGLGGVECA